MIDWLCETFGFEKQLVVAESNKVVMHSSGLVFYSVRCQETCA